MADSKSDKYGIPLVKRTGTIPRKNRAPAAGVNEGTMDAAKKVIDEHRAVIRALAKR